MEEEEADDPAFQRTADVAVAASPGFIHFSETERALHARHAQRPPHSRAQFVPTSALAYITSDPMVSEGTQRWFPDEFDFM